MILGSSFLMTDYCNEEPVSKKIENQSASILSAKESKSFEYELDQSRLDITEQLNKLWIKQSSLEEDWDKTAGGNELEAANFARSCKNLNVYDLILILDNSKEFGGGLDARLDRLAEIGCIDRLSSKILAVVANLKLSTFHRLPLYLVKQWYKLDMAHLYEYMDRNKLYTGFHTTIPNDLFSAFRTKFLQLYHNPLFEMKDAILNHGKPFWLLFLGQCHIHHVSELLSVFEDIGLVLSNDARTGYDRDHEKAAFVIFWRRLFTMTREHFALGNLVNHEEILNLHNIVENVVQAIYDAELRDLISNFDINLYKKKISLVFINAGLQDPYTTEPALDPHRWSAMKLAQVFGHFGHFKNMARLLNEFYQSKPIPTGLYVRDPLLVKSVINDRLENAEDRSYISPSQISELYHVQKTRNDCLWNHIKSPQKMNDLQRTVLQKTLVRFADFGGISYKISAELVIPQYMVEFKEPLNFADENVWNALILEKVDHKILEQCEKITGIQLQWLTKVLVNKFDWGSHDRLAILFTSGCFASALPNFDDVTLTTEGVLPYIPRERLLAIDIPKHIDSITNQTHIYFEEHERLVWLIKIRQIIISTLLTEIFAAHPNSNKFIHLIYLYVREVQEMYAGENTHDASMQCAFLDFGKAGEIIKNMFNAPLDWKWNIIKGTYSKCNANVVHPSVKLLKPGQYRISAIRSKLEESLKNHALMGPTWMAQLVDEYIATFGSVFQDS